MISILINGGPILWIIMVLFFLAAIIIVERILFFKKIRVDEERLFSRVQSAIEKKHYDEALSICDTNESPLSSLMKSGINHRHFPKHTQKEILQEKANLEVPALEKHLSSLGTISHISPLLGLLGTVTGNISSFGLLGGSVSVSDPGLLATGISQALVTTAAGLIVAIPAVIFYNFLVSKVDLILIRMENQVNDMILLLNKDDIVNEDV
ncbi:MotA/TolQ/ExbB proton channel family protein [Thiospirochaeta perfilievii]|uniref:MotA/TolQ/ExbB proton channel family protein n=1 Tax=Thiospirochaeta perfilievii TaxID=252967 RepID=A0A5C1Q9P0_9SPIO|nr:MotA/TolQ/ExbB proton channel family protein [Thiospirochaeta perfilievii]QEN03619.1 MotA/TolQ/ExbB proton channel family protein [Thiospirochaeta perfilievii]